MPHKSSTSNTLKPISVWFQEEFAYVSANFGMLLKAYLYGMLMYFGISVLLMLGGGLAVGIAVALKVGWNLITVPLVAITSIAMFIFLMATAGKMMLLQLQAIKSPLKSIRESWRQLRWQDGLSIYWLIILEMFAIYTGLLALIIPVFIIGTWLAFAIFAWQSKQSGIVSMIKSRDYVRGYFWPVLGRLFIASLAFFLVLGLSMFLYIKMAEESAFFGIIGYIIYILSVGVAGFTISRLFYGLYQNLVAIKGELNPIISGWRKFRWSLLAYGPLVLLVVSMVILAAVNPGAQIKKAQEQAMEGQNQALEAKMKMQELQDKQNLQLELESEE